MNSSSGIVISYRRKAGSELAVLIASDLRKHRYRFFLDVDGLGAGPFDEQLLRQIEEADDINLVLTPGALDSSPCHEDWVRAKATHAIQTKRNIIPVMATGFPFRSKSPELESIPRHRAISYTHEFHKASFEKLRSMRRSQARRSLLGPVLWIVSLRLGRWHGHTGTARS